VKALQTTYRGITYRSRTEARWALFFDILGIHSIYEGEGFDLGGEWYLPDFWFPDAKVWLEIKGIDPTDFEGVKAAKLSQESGRPVFIAVGHPTTDQSTCNVIGYINGDRTDDLQFTDWGIDHIFIADGSGWIVASFKGPQSEIGGAPYPDACLGAARKAQSARFGVHE
jgi:hypothetical protein